MGEVVSSVGVREAKNRFSALAAEVNATGRTLTVMRNNKPWVLISPVDAEECKRRTRLERFRLLTSRIDDQAKSDPVWPNLSDEELLGEERMRRFG